MATCESWAYEIVDHLYDQGKLSAESLMQHLEDTVAIGSCIPDTAKPELKRVFQLAANNDGLLTEDALLNLLRTKTAIRLSPELVEANKIVFSALSYLGNLPLGSKTDSGLDGITFVQFSRALVWILPAICGHILMEDNFSRARTEADDRRLLFQSLASRYPEPLYEAPIARKVALRNAFDYHHHIGSDLCATNYDDDGDEIFHDLLHILYTSQDQDKTPHIAPAPMDAFRPLAKKISTKHNLPVLRTLGIPADRFVALLRLLLAMQFEAPTAQEEPVDLSHFTPPAVSLCAAFTAADTHNIVTHPSFDHGLHQLAPYLLDSLRQFLSLTFLGRPYALLIPRPSQLPGIQNPDRILTLPLAAQLATFLCWNLDYVSLSRHARFTPDVPPESASGLMKAFTPPEDSEPPSVVLFKGRSTVDSEQVVFGLFTPHPGKDGQAIFDVSEPNRVGDHGCALFQLAPVHGVFRGTPGKPGWNMLDERTIVFGEVGAGVCMTISLPCPSSEEAAKEEGNEGKSLGRITARQVMVSGEEEDLDETRGWDREDGWFDEAKAKKEREKEGWTYEGDAGRGNWIAEVEMESVEVWSMGE
ncbi:hypothetical protein B0T16DRAFT_460873 [Cercophora newfieldiana]|uniref:TLDc domain-containing protein n=1 Tax=Cercophora newfieldiana TaxID=92897 RepID=A0AA40CJI3_9PEZI|nr:hypothetical protein B0T16DRAFT_460873 [Cercophora newfieldiana]